MAGGTKSAGGRGSRGRKGAPAKDREHTLDSLIGEAKQGGPRPAYLFSGDEFLVSQATGALIDALVPQGSRDFNLSMLDGAASDASTIARDLAQAPMFPGTKLVVVKDTALLTGKTDLEGEIERAAQLFKDGRERDAARRMLAVIGKARWSIEDLTEASPSKWKKDLGVSKDAVDSGFLKSIRAVVEREEMKVPAPDTDALEKMLDGGAPPGNVLLLTCEKPDRRLAVTKLVESLGVHLVCKAESGRKIEDLDIGSVKRAVLGRYGKTLEPQAERALKRAIGKELRLLAGELEKLCLFTGDAKTITADDVEEVGVRQTREEDFWELGNAVTSRDLPQALWYLHDALAHGRHPVQITGGVGASLRKIFQVRSIAESFGVRRAGRDLPAKAVDEVARVRGGRKPHPFALRMEFERSLAWGSKAEIGRALQATREADRALKTSRGDPRLVVERLVMRICAPNPGSRNVR